MWSPSVKVLPDSRLSRMAARGDARAFEVIFERHHQELYRYCRGILADADDAQDALQATMVAALRALPGEQRDIPLRPWLFRVAHNEAISIARGRRKEAPGNDSDATAPGADLTAEARERMRTLVTDLRALPERQEGAIVMRELSGLSYADIGATLGTSEAAARQLVYEAREAMRESRAARDADCAEIRELISGRDGRVLRGRRVRAHVHACEGCSDFELAITTRRSDLQALAPAMPAVSAAAILGGLLGEAGTVGAAGVSSGAGAGVAGGLGAAGGASAIAKTGAVVAALVVGAGAGVTTALDLRDGALNDSEPEVSSPPPAAAGDAAALPVSGAGRSDSTHVADGAGRSGAGNRQPNRNRHGSGNANGHARAPGPGGSQGQGVPAGSSDGVTGPPPQANGHGPPASAGAGTGNAGGNSASASAASGAPPRSASGSAHSNPSAAGPPDHANGQGTRNH